MTATRDRLKRGTTVLAAALCCLLAGMELPGQEGPLRLDDAFLRGLLEQEAIKRDDHLDSLLGKSVAGRAVVKSVDSVQRYGRPYRILAVDEKAGSRLLYYLFTSNERLKKRLRPGSTQDFTGTLMLHTALAVEKDSFVLDIKLDED